MWLRPLGKNSKPCQTVMQSWYQLGNLYSSHCKDQTEFMTRIKELAKEGGFTNQEEIIKFLFLIHNNNTKVREYLIDEAEPTKTSYDFLVLAKTIESQTQTESMSRKLLEKVSNIPVAAVQRNRSKTPFRPNPDPNLVQEDQALAQGGSVASVDLSTDLKNAKPMVRYVTHVKVEITFGGYAKRLSLNPRATLSLEHLGKINMR